MRRPSSDDSVRDQSLAEKCAGDVLRPCHRTPAFDQDPDGFHVVEFRGFRERHPHPMRAEIADERIEKTSDVLKEGDHVDVKLLAIDDRGRLQLSMKAAKAELEGAK